ncbi:DUF6414 family protein [Clostridium septicum]|uniref:Uncharacterized protein n=1 Tax=Clostridium septicum TaxID=1504 RepID=A0A9N7PLR5_CLOSE|nr:hypothetical protein [Clostridium septicum]AYE35742.1 hypothetical protein CP523_15585 [Clostridium septicum]MDU1314942.1 hypothetical protein [Clostridium septicum]QAS61081.1 hypothetical protein EI377_10300 [Clostridium septicum]UEC19585.1 hypothetical protein LK444_09115 [Clostridium septicum]USS02357.1 hypothetical protein NH397_08065 [Clostridium septicum]
MDNNLLDLFIYMDESLIKNMNALALNGYIDIKTVTNIKDRTLSGNINISNREACGNGEKQGKDKTDGYKVRHHFLDNNYQNTKGIDGGVEGKEYDRIQEQFQRINTTFLLHNELVSSLYDNNNIKLIESENIVEEDLTEGEIIEVQGEITTLSIVPYLNTLINTLICYNTEFLDSLLKDSKLKGLNYTVIVKLLECMKNCITENGTEEMVLSNGKSYIILVVNNTYFLNSKACMYDFTSCPCRVIGKTMKICCSNEKLSLFRKSSQEEYYEKLLKSMDPYFDILEKNGILLPNKPDISIKGKATVMLPISICI